MENRIGMATTDTEHFGKFCDRIVFLVMQGAHNAHILFRKFGLTVSLSCIRLSKILNGMTLVLKRRNPFKILETIVRFITIEVVAPAAIGKARESRTNQSVDIESLAVITLPQTNSHVATLVGSRFEIPNWPTFIRSYASHISKIANLISSFIVQNVLPFFHHTPPCSHYTSYGCQSQMRLWKANHALHR